MLRSMILAAAAIALAGPALADENSCIATKAPGCTVAPGSYKSVNGVPVGVPDVTKDRKFVIEDFVAPGLEDIGRDPRFTDSIYYWDGDHGHLVARETGPLVDIAHF